MLIGLIVVCEVGFWVVLALGLIARYLLQWRKTGMVFLLCVPLLDIILLFAAGIDLYQGTTADVSHGRAAAYLGFTIAFGHNLVQRLIRDLPIDSPKVLNLGARRLTVGPTLSMSGN